MWQDLFRRSDLITRFAQGPWGTHLDEFVSFLRQQQYASNTIRRAVVAADHFADWLSAQQLSLPDASADNVARYLQSGCSPQRNRGLSLAVQFLKYKGIVLPHACTSLETPISLWLAGFDRHLEHVVGAATSTRRQYHVERFLHERFADIEPDWSQLCADDLSSFIQREASRRTGFGRKVPGVALRAFLRFLTARGLVWDGLAAAIPSPRQYQHATLPDRATAEQVTAVLTCCQDGTPVGLRDHAVLLLLARLEMRAHEVARLDRASRESGGVWMYFDEILNSHVDLWDELIVVTSFRRACYPRRCHGFRARAEMLRNQSGAE